MFKIPEFLAEHMLTRQLYCPGNAYTHSWCGTQETDRNLYITPNFKNSLWKDRKVPFSYRLETEIWDEFYMVRETMYGRPPWYYV